jgi:hypothetical protein
MCSPLLVDLIALTLNVLQFAASHSRETMSSCTLPYCLLIEEPGLLLLNNF